ncbi:MAG TPA: COX15/CtaA family protein [Acidocella sp.]|nr:COX15/CtaA family protein [Acidocella sp.]
MKSDKAVSNWLLLLCFMVFGMVVGGGHARTIGAGFSIQVWQPFTGFIPPLNQGDWNHLFALFQQTAQYQAHPIGLTQFKSLFWPMFLDRCWGRLMALVFLFPFVLFWFRNKISNRLALWLLAIFAAGAAQGAFGWYMVLTGLEPGVLSPPPAWAAPHFLSAMLIFTALLWTALTIRRPTPQPIDNAAFLRPWTNASIALILITMGFGALVAATNAITVFNTFPLMDGNFVPPGIFAQHPAWENFVTNQATVQFFHRVLATLTALTVLITAVLGLRAPLTPGLRDNFLLLAGLVALQYVLGMATIVLGAPELGFVHELNAVLLLAAAISARHGLRGAISKSRLFPIAAAGAES